MNSSTKQIRLTQIDFRDRAFLVSYGYTLAPLKQSLKAIGLINPPLVREKTDASYQIVCGHKRLRALRELGIPVVRCTVISSHTSERECMALSVYDNVSHREFNPVEKSMALTKLAQYYPEKEVIRTFLPLLKLHPHKRHLDNYAVLCGMGKEIKTALLEERLSEPTALKLAPMDRASRKALGALLMLLRVSVSTQAEIVENVTEIAMRERVTIEEVASAQEVSALLHSNTLSTPQKADAVRKHLRERRYPRLTEKEREFARTLRQMKLGPSIRLTPPPFFEGSHYQVTLRFKDAGELERDLHKLKKLLRNHPLLTTITG